MEDNNHEEINELNTVNDLVEVFDSNELNLDLTHLSDQKKLWVEKKLFNSKFKDIRNDIIAKINLSLDKKILLKKLKTENFDSIVKNKTKKDLNIKKYNPKTWDYILDARDLDSIENDWILYSDIYKPRLSFKTLLIIKIYKFINYFLDLFIAFIKPIIFISLFLWFIWLYFYSIQLNLKSWFKSLSDISRNDSFDSIRDKVSIANDDLKFARSLFTPISFVNSYIKNNSVNNIDYLLNWWVAISDWWKLIIDSVNSFKKLTLKKELKDINFSDFFANFKPILGRINNDIDLSLENFNKINFNKADLDNKVSKVLNILNNSKHYVWVINNNYDAFLNLLWHNKTRKYVILLQNSDEIRSTWGFIWSLWELDIFRWKIKDFKTRDVYSYEWDIKPYRELPPEWINKITNNFWLRDSNYYIEYRNNSDKIKFFLDKANVNIDWVIYLNLIVVEDVLNLIWWFEFNKINKHIDWDNFSTVMSILVESKIYKSWTLVSPKTILFDFIEEFKNKLLAYNNKEKLLKLIYDDINKWEIVVNTFNKNEEKILSLINITWTKDYESTIDFNYPVFTSIWWNKSDRYLKINYTKKAVKNLDCTIDTSLNINLEHTFSSNDEVYIKELFYNFWLNNIENYNDLMNIQGRGENKQFIRVVLPKNAIIENWDILKEKSHDKYKVVSFYMNVLPKENKNFIIKYKIPNYSCNNYSYIFYKQAWIREYNLEFDYNNNPITKNWLDWNFEFKNN